MTGQVLKASTRPFSPVNIDPARRCLPVECWPLADRQAWAASLEPGDMLDPGGMAATWGANTRLAASQSYGRFLTWLERNRPGDTGLTLTARVTPQAVKIYVAELRDLNAPLTVVFRIDNLSRAVAAMAPTGNWGWLVRIVRRLQHTAKAARNKRSRLVGVDQLFTLGLQMLQEADTRSGSLHWSAALRFRDGLIIALLAARPLRIADFTALEIGRSLLHQGDTYRLVLTDSKTRRPLDLPVPDRLQPWLERYLSHYRPFLCRRAGDGSTSIRRNRQSAGQALWVNRTGGAFAVGSLSERIEFHTKQAFGRAINPHLFRDCAATSIAIEDPEHVRITLSVLGHSRLTTSERYYNHAQSLQATKLYQAHVMALRRRAQARPPGPNTLGWPTGPEVTEGPADTHKPREKS